MAQTTAPVVPDSIKKNIADAYSGKGSASTPGKKQAFPQKVSTKKIDDMLAKAYAKQWTSVKINGSEEFRETVWRRARKLGIAVEGYVPTKAALDRYQAQECRHKKGAGLFAKFFNKTDPKNNKNPGKLSVYQGYTGQESMEGVKPSVGLRALLRINNVVNHPLVQIPLLVGAYCTGPGGCMAYGAIMAAKEAVIGIALEHQKRKEQLKKVETFCKCGMYNEAAKVRGTSRWNYAAPVVKMAASVGLSYAGGFVLGSLFGAGAQPHTLGNLGMIATKMAVGGALLTAGLKVRDSAVHAKRSVMATVAAVGLGTIGACYVGGATQDVWWGKNGTAFFGGNGDTSIAARMASWHAHVR